ncbi:MAG: DUF2058 domain-containing protein [Gammaproteobacteria bacterium]|nr:DUF2058 domain-containing protein [Gammaproteobacteria bacterium]
MGNSLFEQLKKTGLVDEKKAKKVKQGQYKSKKKKGKKGAPAPVSEATLQAQQARAEKAERDRLLNQQRKTAAEGKAIAAQIRQLIQTNRIENCDGEVAYHFTDAAVVKCLHISPQIHGNLVARRLAIAKLDDGYELVPLAVAEKIRQRDEQCIILCGRASEAETAEDDPYTDYKIPDDLMW